jgi:phage baseplate assembly protein W
MSKEKLGKDLRLSEKDLGSDLATSITGDLDTVEEEYNLAQALFIRLRTMQGELRDLGHSSFGSRLYELIGEPNNERTRELARLYTRECVAMDPRVTEILNVSVRPAKGDLNRIDIEISIMAVGLTSALNIVFPFYLEVA